MDFPTNWMFNLFLHHAAGGGEGSKKKKNHQNPVFEK